jgi:rSAM/selenodomain-associated transferase 1
LDSALIILVKNPVLGKVKTRLAATIGNQKALDIYHMLLDHTHKISKDLQIDKIVFYDDFINHLDLWENEIYEKCLQDGIDLGEHMRKAFEQVFEAGRKKVVVIGSDCYELTNKILVNAFDVLSRKDAVIGRATDRGYYLLGMRYLISQIFDEKNWSCHTVFSETIRQLENIHISFDLMKTLRDVDRESDLEFLISD